MSTTVDAIKNEVTTWANEEAKHASGNKSAGTRARKSLSELMKLAVETDRFMQQLKKEGREQYSIGEYVEKVYNPVMNL